MHEAEIHPHDALQAAGPLTPSFAVKYSFAARLGQISKALQAAWQGSLCFAAPTI